MAGDDGVAVSGSSQQWRMKMSLEGKVVMVTGASSGIGREFCLDLSRSGCRIIAAARRKDRLKTLCDQINSVSGVRAIAVQLDVTADGRTIDMAVQTAWDAFGRIDGLVNNAGIRGNVKSPLDVTEEEWNHIFRTNLTGAWLVSKSVSTRMRDAKIGGSIVNISSTAGLNRGHLPGSVAYAASKAALNTLTKMAPYAVNLVPGASMTAHIAQLHASIVAHDQDPFSDFHSLTVRAHRLLWSLPAVHPWVEFRLRYYHFMITGNPGWDGPRFEAQGAWVTIATEVLLREEFEQRGITMETLQHVFPLHQTPPPPAALAQVPPSPPAPGIPLMADSPGQVQVVIDLHDTLAIVVVSSDD